MTQETGVQAGIGRAEITPPVGIAHGNWGAATHSRSEGIDMPLYGNAHEFIIGSERAPSVLVVGDRRFELSRMRPGTHARLEVVPR